MHNFNLRYYVYFSAISTYNKKIDDSFYPGKQLYGTNCEYCVWEKKWDKILLLS